MKMLKGLAVAALFMSVQGAVAMRQSAQGAVARRQSAQGAVAMNQPSVQGAVAMRQFSQDLDAIPFTMRSRFDGGPAGDTLRSSFDARSGMEDFWILYYCQTLIKQWNEFVKKYPVASWTLGQKEEVKRRLNAMSKLVFYEEWKKELEQLQKTLKNREQVEGRINELLDVIRATAASVE